MPAVLKAADTEQFPRRVKVVPRLLNLMFGLVSLASLVAGCGGSQKVGLAKVSSTLYSRTDSNTTTVWAPREHLAAKLGDSAGVESTFAVDSWTSASIDIKTSATKQKVVHEVRKEVTAGGYYEFPNATLSGGYRYSTENDYWSNGGNATLAIDMADNNTTLAISGFGSKDIVGRANDPNWRKPQNSAGGRVSLTQVIDPKSVVQVSWETTHIDGFQASPYRMVAIGGYGTCATLGSLCIPERVPNERFRHALVIHGRRALGDRTSVGLDYRLYRDSWGVMSHTFEPDLAVMVGEHGTFKLVYRYYTQGEASFYRPRYLTDTPVNTSTGQLGYSYVTRDRELSALYANRVSLGYNHEFELGESGTTVLTAAFRAGLTRFKYLAFVGLNTVDALEGTFLLSLDWK